MSRKPNDQTQSSAEPEDDDRLEDLARRFLDLWREQVAATADGAQAASAIGRLYASLGADTTRMGEGFEAWGNLIGQLAMGQNPMPPAGTPLAGMSGSAQNNPLMAMMEQMTKSAATLRPPAMPPGTGFAPDMTAMSRMMTGMTDANTTQATGRNKPSAQSTDRAKGQEKNDRNKPEKSAAKTSAKPAGGAKAASDAHGSRDDELAELARRIADLSETIAALEGRTEGKGPDSSERD